MTRNPIRRSGLVLLSLLLPLSPLSAEDEKDLRDLLRDALYTEEVTRDPEAAAKQYEALLSQHDAQRAFAASALFRLAEVRRKQDRKDEAIPLYQKLLSRFPEAETEGKLARGSLAALGGDLPSSRAAVVDPDDGYIEHLRKIAETSPDQLQEKFLSEVTSGRPKVVEFLISQGVDPKMPKALGIAAETGNLALCKMLLQHGKPSPEEAGLALSGAISNDRSTVLSYLLGQGLDPNSPVIKVNDIVQSPLMIAVEEGKTDAVKALLNHGAEIDFMVQSEGFPRSSDIPFGTPLHRVVRRGDLPMFRLLLEHGANSDLPTPNAGITPLHLAAASSDPVVGEVMVKELLARGADPNRKTTLPLPDSRRPDQTPKEFALVTPLEIAFGNDAGAPLAEAMLAKGASVNILTRSGQTWLSDAVRNRSKERVKYQLKAGADPNLAERDGWTPLMLAAHSSQEEITAVLLEAGADPNKGNDGATPPLSIATRGDLSWPIVKLLFAKGAKAEAATVKKAIMLSEWDFALKMLEAGAPLPEAEKGHPYWSPLTAAVRYADALPLIEKMIAMGAKPEDSWIDSGFSSVRYGAVEIAPPVRSFLFRRFMLPKLEESSTIRIATQGVVFTKVAVLDDAPAPLPPRSLAQALLDPTEAFESDLKVISTDRITIWRKSGGNWSSAAEFRLDTKDDFPALQRGDVIELTGGPDPVKRRDQVLSSGQVLAPELGWSLSKRVSFPVIVEIDGKAKEVTLRGDRLIFDPASPSMVPLVGARQVLQLLWQPELDIRRNATGEGRSIGDSLEVVVRRDGWPDVRLPYNGSKKDFPLREGDRITFESPKLPEASLTMDRKGQVVVKCANGPFMRRFGKVGPSEGLFPATIPTLFQALAEVTQVAGMKDSFSDPVEFHFWLRYAVGWQPVYLQRPDLSKIRIRRLQEDSTEKVMDIDLAKIIAETPEDASINEVRKTDLELQDGDIVEISVLPEDAAKPWSGFTSRENNFLSKALSCRIQITDAAGNISVQEVRYHPPRIVATAGGLVPIPLPGKVSSLSGLASLPRIHNTPDVHNVSRGGAAGLDLASWEVFFREGDRVVLPRSQRVIPPR